MHCHLRKIWPWLVAATLCAGATAAHAEPAALSRQLQAADRAPSLKSTEFLGVARADRRLVAVGERGAIALSDDEGHTWRQARVVPVQATLNDVVFVDAKRGWAVGHLGVILMTLDGGETWKLQRSDTAVDQPLFSVHFRDASHGIAIGLWSLMLTTSDGGNSWIPMKMVTTSKESRDRNLFRLFGDRNGALYISGEKGGVYRSRDGGKTWSLLPTGYDGSLWAGVALHDGTLLVAGLRGTVMRSTDDGQTWARISTGTVSSITSLAEGENGQVFGTGLDGVTLVSGDGGMTFQAKRQESRVTHTYVMPRKTGTPLYFSARGIAVDSH